MFIEKSSLSKFKINPFIRILNTEWFFKTYLTDRNAYDLSIKKVIKNKGMIRITVSEKNAKPLPYKLDLIKDDKIIKEHWINHIPSKPCSVHTTQQAVKIISFRENIWLPYLNEGNIFFLNLQKSSG